MTETKNFIPKESSVWETTLDVALWSMGCMAALHVLNMGIPKLVDVLTSVRGIELACIALYFIWSLSADRVVPDGGIPRGRVSGSIFAVTLSAFLIGAMVSIFGSFPFMKHFYWVISALSAITIPIAIASPLVKSTQDRTTDSIIGSAYTFGLPHLVLFCLLLVIRDPMEGAILSALCMAIESCGTVFARYTDEKVKRICSIMTPAAIAIIAGLFTISTGVFSAFQCAFFVIGIYAGIAIPPYVSNLQLLQMVMGVGISSFLTLMGSFDWGSVI